MAAASGLPEDRLASRFRYAFRNPVHFQADLLKGSGGRATTRRNGRKQVLSVTVSEFRWQEGSRTRRAPGRGQFRRANRTKKGARHEKSHPCSNCFPVAGRLAVRVLSCRWPKPHPVQPNHQAVQLIGQLNLAQVSWLWAAGPKVYALASAARH